MFYDSEVRWNIYIDDPIVVMCGTPKQNAKHMCMLVLTWLAFGFAPSFKKIQHGPQVDWIGHNVCIDKHR